MILDVYVYPGIGPCNRSLLCSKLCNRCKWGKLLRAERHSLKVTAGGVGSLTCVDCWLSSICLFLGPEVPISCSIGWQRPGRKQPQFRYRRIISCWSGPGGGPMGPKLTTTKGGTVLLPQYKWKTIPNWGNTFPCSETEANRCNKRRPFFHRGAITFHIVTW